MLDIVFIIFVVFGVGIVGMIVFGGWAMLSVFRLVGRALFGAGHSQNRLPPLAPNMVRCGNPGCRVDNPARARYCRRCGRMLHPPQPAVVRKVAMW